MMSNNTPLTKVIIVSLPGMRQNVLEETFSKRSDAEMIGIASGGLSAVDLIKQKLPEIVVIDSSLPESEAVALVYWMKKEYPDMRSLVLVETTYQLHDAKRLGADYILRSYTLPESLTTVFGRHGK